MGVRPTHTHNLSASKATLGKLDSIQNAAIWIATGVFKTSPIIRLQ